MNFKVTLLGEEFMADIAFERLNSQMFPQVYLKSRFLRIGNRA